ncbi:hypothetical protein ES706_01820 [subsurface metagenome]
MTSEKQLLNFRIIPTEFHSEGQLLRGNFLVPEGDGPFLGICKFHGLPGSPDQVHGIASRLAEAGFLVLTFDFRGFRRSEGCFSLSGEIEDARNAISHLLDSDYSVKNWVGVYGASYGGAVAVLAAVRDNRISVVCLRASVYDTLAFARSPLIQLAVEDLLRNSPGEMHGLSDPAIRKEILERMVEDSKKLNPIREVSSIAPRPLLIIAGDADEGIDLAGVRRFFEMAKEPKELIVIEGADHKLTDPKAFEKMVDLVVTWFKHQCPT